jgi:hypothetical protein
LNTEFDKLGIGKQVEFINSELKKDVNISVTKLCKKFGFNKNTIVDRFTKKGFHYNFDTKQYIKDTEVIQKDISCISDDKVIPKDNNCISEVAMTTQENNLLEMQEFTELKTTLIEVKELLEMKDQLKEVIQHYNKSKSIIEVPEQQTLRIDRNKLDGELKGRLVKVYSNINDNWIKFCKDNNQFKMQDLYSLALMEFMERYCKK